MTKYISPLEPFTAIGWDASGARVDIALDPDTPYKMIDSHMHMRRIVYDDVFVWVDKDKFQLAENK